MFSSVVKWLQLQRYILFFWRRKLKPYVRTHKKEIIVYIILAVIALIPRITFYFDRLLSVKGLPRTHDTAWYIKHANLLISNFQIDMDFNGIFYFSFYSLLAVLLLIFKSQSIIVFIQMVINALTVILVYKLCLEFTSRRVAVIAGILYSFLWPVIFWSAFIITDSLFISLMVLQAYLAVKASKYKQRNHFVYLSIVSLYMMFFRPTGVVSLGFVLLYLAVNFNFFQYVRQKAKWFILGAIALVACIFAVEKVIYSHDLTASLLRNMWWLLDENYSKGMIYDIKTPYDYKFQAKMPKYLEEFFILKYFFYNFFDIMVLYGKRLVSFFGVWVWKFKERGINYQIKHLLPSLIGVTCITIGYWRFKANKMFKVASITLFMSGSIVFFTVFFFMDAAYRYRIPALVFLIIPLAQGIDYFISILLKYCKIDNNKLHSTL